MNTDIHGSFLGWLLIITTAATIAISAAASCHADDAPSGQLDWSEWRAMPVLDSGRRMPLDTFARETVKAVCGRENPRLQIDGHTKKFSAAELLFCWLTQSEQWDDIAFLRAGNEQLRKEVLDVATRDDLGKHLRYVSPRCVEQSNKFDRLLIELASERQKAEEGGRESKLTETAEAAVELNNAYSVYRLLSFDPRRPSITRTRFYNRLGKVIGTWRNDLAPNLQPWLNPEHKDELGEIVSRLSDAMARLVSLYHKDKISLSEAELPVNNLCDSAGELKAYFSNVRNRAFEVDDADTTTLANARSMVNALALRVNALARESNDLRRAIFDNGRCVRVVPALDPWALEMERDPQNVGQPWLNLQAILYASPRSLDGYPPDKVKAVRDSFEALKTAYNDHDAADRAKRFNREMRCFADAMRELGESVEPARERLPMSKKDDDLIAATAYPPPGFTANEVLYNRLDPFLWAWILTLAALVCFALGFGVLCRPMFILGLVVLALGQFSTVFGLWLRASITGMIPVTNMFETVLFVGATVAILGIWFATLPLFWPGLGRAWQLSALPWRKTSSEDIGAGWSMVRVCTLMVRAVLIGAMVYLLAIGDYNPSGDGPVLELLPKSISAGLSGLSSTIVLWAISLPVFLWVIWFFPRAVPAALLSVVLVPRDLVKRGIKCPFDESLARRVFAVSGAAVALIAYLVAYYAPGPIFNRGVGLEMAAVLRDNFWLTIHVLVITASYGAGALAWALGNVSLAYYAFGKYDAGNDNDTKTTARRGSPKPCAQLAGYTYRAVQLAVLLLAAGTITGAIWADFAWGRYWGWDPKEVWALVTLLAYMIILHGRWAGWTGDFGMAVGAVLGATSIMMAWYGVNFVLAGGLHSYGFGSGGQTPVLILVGCNWVFVILAAVRYFRAQGGRPLRPKKTE